MIELNGKYNSCKIFTDLAEPEAINQLINTMDYPNVPSGKIRIMPDMHAGTGCVIGTTMEITDRVCPNAVGVDIGCGVLCVCLKEKTINLPTFDEAVHKCVPAGFDIREVPVTDMSELLTIIAPIDINTALRSIGTLGGGNHFIEVAKSSSGYIWLLIHTGSRHLGIEVASYWQKKACQTYKAENVDARFNKEKKELITSLKNQGRQREINNALKNLFDEISAQTPYIPNDLMDVHGNDFTGYLHDMHITQSYASLNRRMIANTILSYTGLHESDSFETVHNYIDLEHMILRKGAVSAQVGEHLIIPMNMRDGSLLCVGKGNPDWNYSAPHGAGRLMSRSKAKREISLSEFKNAMSGIYSTTVCESTIDESPMAYKPMDNILRDIHDTVDVIDVLKPIYNFKAT